MTKDLLDEDYDIEQKDSSVRPEHGSPQAPLTSHTELPQIQSSLSKQIATNAGPRTPRTPNRVRFIIGERLSGGYEPDRRIQSPTSEHEEWGEEEGFGPYDRHDSDASITGQRAPLLTGIEAPSVTVASDLGFHLEDLVENPRPKSEMSSAFMNMANSIM